MRRRRIPRAPSYLFWMLIVYLVLEYIRPEGLSQLKLQFIIILLIPLLWLRERRRPWSVALTVQALFVVWCAQAIPFASNYFFAYMSMRVGLMTLTIGIALTWVGSNFRDLKRLIWFWVALMTYQGAWSITHGGRGTGGFLGDENDVALACGTAVALAFFGVSRLRGRVRWGCLIALVTLILGIVSSMSRGGFVGLVAVGVYCLAKSRHKLRALLVVGSFVIAVPLFAPSEYIDEIRSIQDTGSGTAESRFFLWEAAIHMWLEHPIRGVGGKNSSFLVGSYQPDGYGVQNRSWSGTSIHSVYFELLSEHGIVGVALVTFLIGYQFWNVRRLIRHLRRTPGVPRALRREVEVLAFGLNGGLVGFLAAGAFLSVLYYPYLWYLTVLSSALDIAVRRELSVLRTPGGSAIRSPEIPS